MHNMENCKSMHNLPQNTYIHDACPSKKLKCPGPSSRRQITIMQQNEPRKHNAIPKFCKVMKTKVIHPLPPTITTREHFRKWRKTNRQNFEYIEDTGAIFVGTFSITFVSTASVLAKAVFVFGETALPKSFPIVAAAFPI